MEVRLFISDNEIIINTTGLRSVAKRDGHRLGEPQYLLLWEYKETKLEHGYEQKQDRNAIFDKLRDALIKERK